MPDTLSLIKVDKSTEHGTSPVPRPADYARDSLVRNSEYLLKDRLADNFTGILDPLRE